MQNKNVPRRSHLCFLRLRAWGMPSENSGPPKCMMSNKSISRTDKARLHPLLLAFSHLWTTRGFCVSGYPVFPLDDVVTKKRGGGMGECGLCGVPFWMMAVNITRNTPVFCPPTLSLPSVSSPRWEYRYNVCLLKPPPF